jgi:MFS transporter, DHA1 family, tetracycline resistance protein
MADFDIRTVAPTSGEPAAGPPLPDERARKSALLIVFLVVFIDLLGFGIVLPLLPLYATELIDPLFPQDDGLGWLHGPILGALMSSFSLMQFFFAPYWGRLSDRMGRRPILLIGLAGSVIFYGLFGIASILGGGLGLALMFAARVGAGIFGATIAAAQAVIADCTPPDKRAHGMAIIGIAFGCGFTLGPLLGFASLFVPTPGAPGLAAAMLSSVALGLGLVLLPETLRPGMRAGRRTLFDWQGYQRVLRTPTVGMLVFAFFLATFAFGSLESTQSLVNKLLLTGQVERDSRITREALMTSTERINFLVFAYIGFVLMTVQGVIYRRWVRRFGEVRFLRLGVLLMALGLAGGVAVLLVRGWFEPGWSTLLLGLPFVTLGVIGFAFMTPSAQALISRRSDPARQGEVLGVNQSASAVARILGPFVALSTFFLSSTHVIPFAGGCLLLLLVAAVSLRLQQD